MNKLRGSTVVRPDPKEDGITKSSNVVKFLAACASYGLPHEDLFQREDLIDGTSESLARVAQTIVALITFIESPAPSRSKYMSGQGKSINAGTRSPYGTLSGISSSTPNLLSSSSSDPSPVRKRWGPANGLDTVRSHSPDGPSTETIKGLSDRHGGRIEEDGDEVDFKPVRVPIIGKPPPPPKSPLRKQTSRTQDPGGLFTWAKNAASGHPEASGNPSLHESASRDFVRQSRQSMASSVTTALSNAPSSLLDPSHSQSTKYGTIRTVTTDMTSEAPSITRTEGNSIAEAMWKKTPDVPQSPSRFRERKSSELHSVDLSRVAEETDDSTSRGSRDREETGVASPTRPAAKPAINLRKGKWPDDFLDAFEKHKPQLSISTSTSAPQSDAGLSRASPIPLTSPRKLAVVGANRSNDEGQSPRRPTHRPRHSIDTPGLLPRESLREASPDSATTGTSASSRVMLRRHSTKAAVARTGSISPRTVETVQESDFTVPFPRAVSGGDAANAPSPSPTTSSGADTAVAEGRPRLRGRFQSDVESSSARARGRSDSRDDGIGRPKRARFESMVNLGTSSNGASASDLLVRNSLDGASARSLVVKEDGRAPVHFVSLFPGLFGMHETLIHAYLDFSNLATVLGVVSLDPCIVRLTSIRAKWWR